MSKRHVSNLMISYAAEAIVHQFRMSRCKQDLEKAKKTCNNEAIKAREKEMFDIQADCRALKRDILTEIDRYYKR